MWNWTYLEHQIGSLITNTDIYLMESGSCESLGSCLLVSPSPPNSVPLPWSWGFTIVHLAASQPCCGVPSDAFLTYQTPYPRLHPSSSCVAAPPPLTATCLWMQSRPFDFKLCSAIKHLNKYLGGSPSFGNKAARRRIYPRRSWDFQIVNNPRAQVENEFF